jgi:hypothetical protein
VLNNPVTVIDPRGLTGAELALGAACAAAPEVCGAAVAGVIVGSFIMCKSIGICPNLMDLLPESSYEPPPYPIFQLPPPDTRLIPPESVFVPQTVFPFPEPTQCPGPDEQVIPPEFPYSGPEIIPLGEPLLPLVAASTGRVDTSHSSYDDALENARRNAGDLGSDIQRMYDPDTGTLIGERSADGTRGWRIDEDHVNWWDWSQGKKGSGGAYGHEWFPSAQSGPHSWYKGYTTWE